MLRWLVRLLVIGLIVAAAAFAANRLMNREEDFDDFDDVDAGFEFEETPVEIDVPAEEAQAGQAGGGAQAMATEGAAVADTGGDGAGSDGAGAEGVRLIEV